MGRLNIQHPVTKQWRCFSTIVDTWVSDWMSEEDYKTFLIQEAINEVTSELEAYGVRRAMIPYNQVVFTAARMDWRNGHCRNCENHDCDNCKVFAHSLETYIKYSDDFLGCKADFCPED